MHGKIASSQPKIERTGGSATRIENLVTEDLDIPSVAVCKKS